MKNCTSSLHPPAFLLHPSIQAEGGGVEPRARRPHPLSRRRSRHPRLHLPMSCVSGGARTLRLAGSLASRAFWNTAGATKNRAILRIARLMCFVLASRRVYAHPLRSILGSLDELAELDEQIRMGRVNYIVRIGRGKKNLHIARPKRREREDAMARRWREESWWSALLRGFLCAFATWRSLFRVHRRPTTAPIPAISGTFPFSSLKGSRVVADNKGIRLVCGESSDIARMAAPVL